MLCSRIIIIIITFYNDTVKITSANVCADENYMENDVACLTTTGDILILSLPQLRQQMKVEGIKCDSR